MPDSAPSAAAGPKVSVTVIVQDEAANIAACLESCRWADEIVVVDSWSKDETAKIAAQFTDRIFQREYAGQVDKKNHAVERASHDWILSVDADERIPPALATEIRRTLAQTGPTAVAHRIRRRTFYFGREIRWGEWNPDWVVRLFDRRRAKFGGTDPHDHVVVDGVVGDLREPMLHYSYRDFAQQIDRIQRFSGFAARAYHARGARAGWWMLLVRPWFRFVRGYVWKLGFLDGIPGLAVAMGSGFYAFCRAVKLWELQQGAPKE